MELVSTMEINGEEREIADAYAREQCATNAQNIATNAEGIAGLNNNLSQLEIDLKMLGYTVPKEMSVQNYVDSDGVFHQKVGRVDLGSLNWRYESSLVRFEANVPNKIIPSSDSEWDRGLYCSIYKRDASPIMGTKVDMTISGYRDIANIYVYNFSYTDATTFKNAMKGVYLYYELETEQTISVDGNETVTKVNDSLDGLKSDLSKQCKKDDITTNETLIGTFNGKNYYRKLFTGIGASGGSVTVNVGEKIEIYNYYGRAYVYGQSGASAEKYPIPNKNYYIDSQNISETSFQLTIPTSSDTRKVDLVIEYTKVDE